MKHAPMDAFQTLKNISSGFHLSILQLVCREFRIFSMIDDRVLEQEFITCHISIKLKYMHLENLAKKMQYEDLQIDSI